MNTKELDQFLEGMPLRGFPEVEVSVTKDRRQIYRKAVGFDDPNRNIYFVCSVSKVTTCVAALRLWEEGKLNFDDPVSKYLPAFAHLTVKQKDGPALPAKNIMTVQHLFTMTGGMNYKLNTEPILQTLEKNPHAGTIDLVNAIAAGPLEFEPGESFHYSLCHDALAAVVEVIAGMKFRDYVQKTVLDPLGMTDSGYHFPETLRPRLARMFAFRRADFSSREVEPYNQFILSDEYDSGGAGLYTTTDDQMKLLTCLANGGVTEDGYRLLKPETLALCEQPQLTANQMDRYFWSNRLYGYSWGYCGRVHVNPLVSMSLSPAGEFGWDGATGPYALVDRKNHLAFYFGVHMRGGTPLYNQYHAQMRDMVYRMVFGE